MRAFLKSRPGKLCIAAVSLVLLAALGLCGYTGWHWLQPKFHDVVIELGEAFPPVEAFLNPLADPAKAVLHTTTADLSQTGSKELTFSHNGKEEVVYLHIWDTTPPTARFLDLTLDIDAEITPEMFVADVFDLTKTTVSFASDFDDPKAAGKTKFEIVVADETDNSAHGTVTLTRIWMHETVTLEVGQTLTQEMILTNPERDGEMIDQKMLDQINKAKVGVYMLELKGDGREGICTVTVQDTVAPTLVLKDVNIDVGDKLTVNKFVKESSDASGKVTTAFKDTPNNKKEGTYTVTVIATDKNGNQTEATATLKVHKDSKPPVFSGLKALSVKKNATVNFRSGVKAKDAKDGYVDFTVDNSKVNLSKSGTYYAIYTAKDAAGNKATARRKITVTHSAEDTQALVDKAASKVSSDPVEIMKYVRKTIKYNHNWGGDDPVWYGLKNKTGNCYVHAKVLQEIFTKKGIKSRLIWVTDKSHYWNIVYINGRWWHIDSTPGTKHPARLMDDTDRYNNLQGRNWDRSKWPKCE